MMKYFDNVVTNTRCYTMDPLLASFISETQDMLNELEEAMLSLEQDFQQEAIDKIFRFVHTIKGNSGLFDLSNVTELAHKFETVLNKLRSGEMSVQANMIDVFLNSIDRLRTMVSDIHNSGSVAIDDIVQNLTLVSTGQEASITKNTTKPVTEPVLQNESELSPASTATVARPEPELEFDCYEYLANEIDEIEDQLVSLENNPERAVIEKLLSKIWPIYSSAKEQGIENLRDLSQDLLISLNLLQQDKLAANVETIDLFLMATDLLRSISIQRDGSTDVLEVLNVFRKNQDVQLKNLPSQPAPTTGSQQLKIPKSFFNRARAENKYLGLYRYQLQQSDAEDYIAGIFQEKCELLQITQTSTEKYAVIALSFDKPETIAADQKLQAFNFNTLVQRDDDDQEKREPPVEPKPDKITGTKQLAAATEVKQETPVASKSKPAETHLRVPIELIDQVINKAGETIISRNELIQKIDSARDPALLNSGKKISGLITQLQEDIMRTRMQQLNVVFNKIPRIVRDIERATEKKVELTIEGGEIDLDKTILDIINDPIMHMVRNSIDHGIEDEATRLAAGKPAHGRLHISALLRGGKVLLKIRDDGKGLNLERIKAKAIQNGLLDEESAEKADESTITNLIFQPGFSTAAEVTTTSGRGVGMDVVRSNIMKAGGSVDLQTEEGNGTLITATLPQTLSIITCLIIRNENRRFALPQQNIDRLILTKKKKISLVENRMMYEISDQLVPLFNLNHLLELNAKNPAINEVTEKYVAVVKSEQHRYALLIDNIVNPEEIVIKPLSKHFQNLRWFSGATIMGDGEAILILDIPGIARELALPGRTTESIFSSSDENNKAIHENQEGYLAFISHSQHFAVSLTSKPRIERILPANHKRFAGYDIIRHENQIVPLLRLADIFPYLESNQPEKQRFAILFSYHGQTLGIMVSKIVNILAQIPEVDQDKFDDEVIQGSALIDGQATLLLEYEKLLYAFMKRIRLFSKAKELTLVRRKKSVKVKSDVKS